MCVCVSPYIYIYINRRGHVIVNSIESFENARKMFSPVGECDVKSKNNKIREKRVLTKGRGENEKKKKRKEKRKERKKKRETK